MSQANAVNPKTLGLELSTSLGAHRLTFAPFADRVFVLGSSVHADVQLDRPGIEPVSCHVERQGDQFCLVPALRGQRIRVDAEPVTERALLRDGSVIELAGERIIARPFDPHALPDQADPTCLASPVAPRGEVTDLAVTRVMRPAPIREVTELMLRPAAPPLRVPPPTPIREVTELIVRTEAAPDALPVLRLPAAAGDDPTVISAAPSSGQRLERAVESVARRLQQPSGAVVKRAKVSQTSVLAALGRLTMKRPLLTIAAFACVAAALAISAAGLIRAPARPSSARSAASAPPVALTGRGAPALNPAPEPPGAPVVVLSASSATPPASNSAPQTRRREPLDAELSEAIQALAQGRDEQARVAYEHLGTRTPTDPAYTSLARLLRRLGSADCTAAAPPPGVSCPEVKR